MLDLERHEQAGRGEDDQGEDDDWSRLPRRS